MVVVVDVAVAVVVAVVAVVAVAVGCCGCELAVTDSLRRTRNRNHVISLRVGSNDLKHKKNGSYSARAS